MKPCAYCDVDFEPAVKAQRFCSKTCAALHQRAVSPRPRKPGARKWRAKTPEQRAAYGSEYRRARDALVAAALGSACPGCGRTLTAANATADHVTARDLGGGGSYTNLRALCGDCNHRRGSSLGGRVTSARRTARKRAGLT